MTPVKRSLSMFAAAVSLGCAVAGFLHPAWLAPGLLLLGVAFVLRQS